MSPRFSAVTYMFPSESPASTSWNAEFLNFGLYCVERVEFPQIIVFATLYPSALSFIISMPPLEFLDTVLFTTFAPSARRSPPFSLLNIDELTTVASPARYRPPPAFSTAARSPAALL